MKRDQPKGEYRGEEASRAEASSGGILPIPRESRAVWWHPSAKKKGFKNRCIYCKREFVSRHHSELLCDDCVKSIGRPLEFQARVILDAQGFIWIQCDDEQLPKIEFKLVRASVPVKRRPDPTAEMMAKVERLFLPYEGREVK